MYCPPLPASSGFGVVAGGGGGVNPLLDWPAAVAVSVLLKHQLAQKLIKNDELKIFKENCCVGARQYYVFCHHFCDV